MTPCTCSVCHGEAESVDGYCGFCAMRCFPVGTVNGQLVRIKNSEETRKELHADVWNNPNPRDLWLRAAGSAAKIALKPETLAQVQAGIDVAQQLAPVVPMVSPHLERLVKVIAWKMRKKP